MLSADLRKLLIAQIGDERAAHVFDLIECASDLFQAEALLPSLE